MPYGDTDIWINIGSSKGLLPDSNTSLPGPILTNHQWRLIALSKVQFHGKCSINSSLIWGWKLHIQDFSCISQGPLQWRHTGHDSISNHQPHNCLLFRRRSKKTSKLRITGLWAGNSLVTGEFPAQMASNAQNVSIWWHHHGQWIISGHGSHM